MGWLNLLPQTVVKTSLLIAGISLVTAAGLRTWKNRKGEKQDRNKKPDEQQEKVAANKYCYKNLQYTMPPKTKLGLNAIYLRTRRYTFDPMQVKILLRLIARGRFNNKMVVYDRYLAEDLIGEPGPTPDSWLVDRQLYKWDEMRIRCENLIERMITDDNFRIKARYELLEHTITHATYYFDRRYDALMEMRLMEEGNNNN